MLESASRQLATHSPHLPTTSPKFGFDASKHIDLKNVDAGAIEIAVELLDAKLPADQLTQLLTFDAAKIAADFELEDQLPSLAQRTASLWKIGRLTLRLANHLSALTEPSAEGVEQALQRIEPDDSGLAEIPDYIRRVVLWLYQEKYRVKRSPLDRSLKRCVDALAVQDHVLDSDLLNGLWLRGTRPFWVHDQSQRDHLIFVLCWHSNAAQAVAANLGKPGPRMKSGLHTAVAYLAPRFDDLCSTTNATYWGTYETRSELSLFTQFVVAMLNAADVNVSQDEISYAVRTYCQSRNERLKNAGK